MPSTPHRVADILENLRKLAEGRGKVSVGAVVESFGRRSYGPFLLLPSMIGISPLGGVPGVPTFLALTIGLVALQIVIGNSYLWLPGIIKRREVSAEKLRRACDRMQGAARFLDRMFHRRLKRFTRDPMPRIAAAIVLALCCTVPPLELLPFAVALPMAVIGAFGLAILVRDGVLMLAAVAGALAAAAIAAASLLGG